MLKILVVSDTHGNTVRLGRIVRRESPFDYLFHCGDGGDPACRVPAGGGRPRCGNATHGAELDAERFVVMQVGTVTGWRRRRPVPRELRAGDRAGGRSRNATRSFGHARIVTRRYSRPLPIARQNGVQAPRRFFDQRRAENLEDWCGPWAPLGSAVHRDASLR